MIKIKPVILMGQFASLFVSSVSAETMTHEKYQSIKQEALDFEKILKPEVLSALNLSNGPILKDIFETCTPLQLPTTFEVVAKVNPQGVVDKAWSNTQTIFGQCAAKVFIGKLQYPINNQFYYSILNFTLSYK